MKITIKNLTNSPYRIGAHTLPARGGLRGVEATAAEVAQYRTLGYLEIREELQQEHDQEDALRAAYEAASGKQSDKRWSEKRLQEEIAKLKD